MRKLILFITLILSCYFSYSQKKGYAGKIHHLSFDVGRIYWGYYSAEYKVSLWKHFGLAATAGIIQKETSINAPDLYGSSLTEYLKFEGKSLGIGVVYNSPHAGMSMPVGFYSGIYFIRSFGNQYDLSEDKSVNNTFDFKGNLLKAYFGKNIVIAKYVTIDLGIGTGIFWGQLNSLKANYEPVGMLPSPLFFKKYAEMETDLFRNTFIKYYILPEVKLGYIF